MKTVARLLVRLPNWLGDLLMARPLLHGLRRSAAEIFAVGPPGLLELLAGEALFDRVAAWPRERSARSGLLATVRAWSPEAALVLPPSFSSAWFPWRAGVPRRIGFRGDGRDLLLTHAAPRPARGDLHLSEEYRRLGAEVAPAPWPHAPEPPPDLPLPEHAHVAARALLEREGAGDRRVAVIGPGALYGPAKRWPAERFAAVGRALAAEGRAILVCGVEGERTTCERVAHAIGPDAIPLAGRTDLLVQAALCAGAEVAVCNDSGLAHLSAAVGTPTVAIFGSTSSAWTAPLGRRVRVVQDAPVCSPCFQRTCRIGTVCLAAVSVARVVAACAEAVA